MSLLLTAAGTLGFVFGSGLDTYFGARALMGLLALTLAGANLSPIGMGRFAMVRRVHKVGNHPSKVVWVVAVTVAMVSVAATHSTGNGSQRLQSVERPRSTAACFRTASGIWSTSVVRTWFGTTFAKLQIRGYCPGPPRDLLRPDLRLLSRRDRATGRGVLRHGHLAGEAESGQSCCRA